MKKKIEIGSLKTGTVFKRKGSRILYMKTDVDDVQILTGKNKGCVDFTILDDELVTPTKVKISEVK